MALNVFLVSFNHMLCGAVPVIVNAEITPGEDGVFTGHPDYWEPGNQTEVEVELQMPGIDLNNEKLDEHIASELAELALEELKKQFDIGEAA